MAIGPTRFGLRAATARRIRFAIRRSELERRGLDTCRALAGCRSERTLSRGEPRDGLATRRFSRIDGKELARSLYGAWAAGRRPPPGDAGGDASIRVAGRPRRMATADQDWRQPSSDRLRHLPACPPAAPAGAGADTTDTARTLVLRSGDCSWGGIYVGADLSRALPGRPPPQR